MSMLTLNGQVVNVFDSPESIDRKTGEVRAAASRVQIMARNTLQTGAERFELVTLKVDYPELYKPLVGASIRVPVGVFSDGKTVLFYALKGQAPERLATAGAAASASRVGA
jgi:hypothetical protein